MFEKKRNFKLISLFILICCYYLFYFQKVLIKDILIEEFKNFTTYSQVYEDLILLLYFMMSKKDFI